MGAASPVVSASVQDESDIIFLQVPQPQACVLKRLSFCSCLRAASTQTGSSASSNAASASAGAAGAVSIGQGSRSSDRQQLGASTGVGAGDADGSGPKKHRDIATPNVTVQYAEVSGAGLL